MQDKLEQEQQKLQERITYHDQLISERSKLDNLIMQNQAAILQIQGRVSMLQELIADDTDTSAE